MLEINIYLCSVCTGETELHNEDRLGGDNSVVGRVGRGADHWICAAIS